MQTNRFADGNGTLDGEFAGPLVAASVGLCAGVFVGGWLAFDTRHWELFRAIVDGTPVVSFLHIGLFLFVLAVLFGTGVASARADE